MDAFSLADFEIVTYIDYGKKIMVYCQRNFK